MMVHKRIALSVSLLLGAFLLLMMQFPHNSLWYDETTSAYLATHDWHHIREWATGLDIHPPLYNALLKIWVNFLGASQFSLRLFSVMSGLIAFAGMIRLGRQISGRWAGGWAAALILLLTGGFLYAAYEVRSYMLALTLGIYATIFLLRVYRSSNRLDGLLYGMLVLAGLLTHYAAIFLLAAHGAYILLYQVGAWVTGRQRLSLSVFLNRFWIFALPVIGFAGWYAILQMNGGLPDGLSFDGSVEIEAALRQYSAFLLYGQVIPDQFADQLAVIFTGLLAFSLLLILMQRQIPLLPLLLIMMPLAGLAALFVLGEAKLSGRHGWVMWIGVPLLIGYSFRWRSISRVILPFVVFFLGYTAVLVRPDLPDQYPGDLQGAFAYINQHADPSDVLILRDGTLFTAAAYYDVAIPYVGLPADPLTNVNHKLTFHEAADLIKAIPAGEAAHIWLISWQGDTMDPQGLAFGLAEYAGGTPEEVHWFGDVQLLRYQVKRDVTTLFDHIVAMPGLLLIPPDGPSLLGADVYVAQTGAGCPVIVHTWWWRGATDDPHARISYRLVDPEDHSYRYHQQDSYLSAMTYDQPEWEPFVPVLGRGVLTLPDNVDAVDVLLTTYDTTGAKPEQNVPLMTIQIDEATCPEQAALINPASPAR